MKITIAGHRLGVYLDNDAGTAFDLITKIVINSFVYLGFEELFLIPGEGRCKYLTVC